MQKTSNIPILEECQPQTAKQERKKKIKQNNIKIYTYIINIKMD